MRSTLAVLLTSSLLLVSGCGVAATQFHPGLAAQVGKGTVTTSDVDDASAAFCRYLLNDGQVISAPLPMSQLRSEIAAQLALLEASKQLADERHVTTGKIYQQAIADDAKDPANKGLSADDLKQVVLLNTSAAYIGDIILAVGTQIETAAGTTIPTDPTKANAVVSPAGVKALSAWIDSHDVQIDPRYDVHLDGTTATPGDEGISFADSAIAKSGIALGTTANPGSADAIKALPAAQRCGG